MTSNLWLKEKGEKGDTGTGINWLGNFDTAPVIPFEGDAYRNTLENISYVYSDDSWDILTNPSDERPDVFTAVDGDVIELENQTTVIKVDCTTADVNIELTPFTFEGQTVGVYPTGNYTCYITGTGLEDATAQSDNYFRAEVIDDALVEIITGGSGTGSSDLQAGDFLYASTYKDRSSEGLLGFQFDSCSVGLYPELYAVVGDIFEQAHIDAGQAASADGYFYPTPVPGSYGKSALPEITFTDAEVTDNGSVLLQIADSIFLDGFRDGTPFRFEVTDGTAPTGLTDGEIYYFSFTDGYCRPFPTEADAVANTNSITFSDSGSGTFKLTQAGLAQGFALQGHSARYFYNNITPTNSLNQQINDATQGGDYESSAEYKDLPLVTASAYGELKITNQTRGDEYFQFGYIKAEAVIEFEGEPVSGVKTELELGLDARDWQAQEFVFTHNLNALPRDLSIKIEIYKANGFDWQEPQAFIWDSPTASSTNYGYSIKNGDDLDSFKVITGTSGIAGVSDYTYGLTGLTDGVEGNMRATVIKHNYSTVIIDQAAYTNKTVVASAGDTVNLTAQTTLIKASGDITLGTNSYDGQRAIFKNTGTSDITITDSTGTWPKSATLRSGKTATCDICDGVPTEGDLTFVWIIGTDIPFSNDWDTYDSSYPVEISLNSGKCLSKGLLRYGVGNTIMCTLPERIRPTTNIYIPCAYRLGTSDYKSSIILIYPIGSFLIYGDCTTASSFISMSITWEC